MFSHLAVTHWSTCEVVNFMGFRTISVLFSDVPGRGRAQQNLTSGQKKVLAKYNATFWAQFHQKAGSK